VHNPEIILKCNDIIILKTKCSVLSIKYYINTYPKLARSLGQLLLPKYANSGFSMTTITLSQTLFDTDLSSIGSTSSIFDYLDEINSLTTSLLSDSEFLDSPIVTGRTTSYVNPSISSTLGKATISGKISRVDDSRGNLVSGSIDIKGMSLATADGKLNYKLVISGTTTTQRASLKINATDIYFKGTDGFSWSVKCDVSATLNINLVTEQVTGNSRTAYKSITMSDAIGNSVSYTGNIRYNSTSEDYSGYFTNQLITIGKTKISSNGFKITYEDLVSGVEVGSIIDMLPTILASNDVITLSSIDPISDSIYGYGGNDKITGTSDNDILYGDNGKGDEYDGNDTLNGGGGDDELFGGYGDDKLEGGEGDDSLNGEAGKNTLTGGKGADIFILSSEFIDTEIPKNTKITTITDFKDSEGDTLDIDLDYVVFKSLKIAAAEESSDEIVYESSTGKFWYDADGAVGGDFKPVCFAICVGIPTD
jgi:Ca2+-binding RTX toxin-like protein